MLPVLFWTVLGIGAAISIAYALGRARAKAEEAEPNQQDEREQREEERREFMKSAKLVRAEVLSSFQLGTYNLMPDLQIHLRVEAPDGPFEVDVSTAVEPTRLHLLADGNIVDVWFNPAQRGRVILELDQKFVKLIRDGDKDIEKADKMLRGSE